MRKKNYYADLFDKLPDEVLEVILNNLTSPTDKANITTASTTCGNILHPTKPTYLFHKLISSLAAYLHKPELLNLRLVCTEWKTSTDEYLEHSEMFNDEMFFRKNSPFWPRRSRSITEFMRIMQCHREYHLNPFPGRRAAFGRIRREGADFEYWGNVLRLLGDFGGELWDVRLDFEDIVFERFVVILSGCVRVLPCLKRLQIVYFGRPSATSDPKLYLRNLFPGALVLEHLELNGTFPGLFYSEFLACYRGSVRVVKLHQVVPENVSLVDMSVVEVLKVFAKSNGELSKLLPNSPLSFLSISIYCEDSYELFERLGVYANTLKKLEISFESVGVQEFEHVTRENHIPSFPNVTDLKLKNAPVELLDSLQSFPVVENLEFECLEKGWCLPVNEETCGNFRIFGCPANKLYSSGIWGVLPFLEVCRLSCYQLVSGREFKYAYYRGRYEYLRGRMEDVNK